MSVERIHNYLDGLMTVEDASAFEKQMKNDPKFAQEVSLYREIREFASQKADHTNAVAAIKEVGDSFNPKQVENKPISRNQWRFLLPIAAAALVLIGVFSKSLFDSSQSSPDQIAYEISPLSFQERSQTSPSPLLHSSAVAFNANQYSIAIEQLDELITSGNEKEKARLYKSIALLRTNQHDIARMELKRLASIPMYDNASFYYRGLSYLETKEIDAAVSMFAQVKETSSYFERSQERIKQLKQIK